MNAKQRDALLTSLQKRFEQNISRHKDLAWQKVAARLESAPDKLRTLAAMEKTGGEPDVVGYDKKTGEVTFMDCSPQSPEGRRSLCFDAAALAARKANKPNGSAVELAEKMGATLLTEEQYRALQTLGEFDTKTSSWIQTPAEIRKRGGALFCDRRYDHVFVYHNGADSYYAARGFRVALIV